MAEPLIISNFQDAVAGSPYQGHALMRNIDIDAFPGAMRARNLMFSMIPGVTTRTFTADASTDICTASGSLVTQAETDATTNYGIAAVQFTTTGTLPAGLSLATTYFLIYVSDTTFKVATTVANALASTAIDITDAGSGVHTVTSLSVGTIKWIVRDKNTGNYFAVDSNGRVWYTRGSVIAYLLTGNTLTQGHGNGLAIFRVSDGTATYLFVFRDNVVDVINVYASANLDTPVWSTNWQSLNAASGSSKRHQALVGQDNIIYFVDDRYVGSIQEKAGSVFDPASAATYTYNNQALTLPQNEYAYCLEELNTNLLVGGNNFNKIYPWDRVSSSFTIPLQVPENSIFEMKNLGNRVVILAGTKGNVYSTQGTYVKLFREIPTYITNNSNNLVTAPATWGGIAARTGAVVFGVAFPSNTTASGIYVLYEDGRLLQDNTAYGGAQNVTALYAESEITSFVIGYAGGFDYSAATKPSSATYRAVYQSELFKVGDAIHKMKYSSLEIQQGRNQGGKIRIGYRTDLTSAFTTMLTTSTNQMSYKLDSGLTNLEVVQFQVEFDSNIEISRIALFP